MLGSGPGAHLVPRSAGRRLGTERRVGSRNGNTSRGTRTGTKILRRQGSGTGGWLEQKVLEWERSKEEVWYEDLFHVFFATFSHLRTNPAPVNSLLPKSFHLIFGCADWFSRKCILPLCNDLSGTCHLWYKSQRRCTAKGAQWQSLAEWEERSGSGAGRG